MFIIEKESILERVIIFCNILKKNFFEKTTKINTISFNNKLANLCQKKNKVLIFYYQRIISIIQQIEKKDRFSSIILFIFKLAIRDTVIRTFVRDLTDSNINIEIIYTVVAIDRSLKSIYNLIEKMYCIKIEIKKFQKKKFKNKKLDFYCILVQKTISKIQLDLFITIYQSQFFEI